MKNFITSTTFCPKCGKETDVSESGYASYCVHCGTKFFHSRILDKHKKPSNDPKERKKDARDSSKETAERPAKTQIKPARAPSPEPSNDSTKSNLKDTTPSLLWIFVPPIAWFIWGALLAESAKHEDELGSFLGTGIGIIAALYLFGGNEGHFGFPSLLLLLMVTGCIVNI